ncbi:MAG TPA: condensation domain-containing protein, partial [Candidatus Wallbacteria bacterium]|nr:condensation domain-containing protein [Candidatus Wallbacteria bacterium]
NFFLIGGNSIKAIAAVSKLSKDFEITINDIFEFPTIARLNLNIKPSREALNKKGVSSAGREAAIPFAAKKEYYPLSYSQKRMYVLNKMQQDQFAYNITSGLLLEGDLDKNRLSRAIDELIKRHGSMRTSFEVIDGEPVQKINQTVKLKKIFKKAEESEVDSCMQEFVKSFELSKPPLFNIMLLEVSAKKHIFIMDAHHIIMDGISLEIFYDELLGLYEGKDPGPAAYQYSDYSEWERSDEVQKSLLKQELYWKEVFKTDVPVLSLPQDYPRPAVKSSEGDALIFTIDSAVTQNLKKLCLETGSTMFMLLLSAFNLLLHKYSGNDDIVIGTPCSGRTVSELDRVIGMFVSTVPMRNYPAAQKTFRDFLIEVRKNTLDAFNNQQFPFDRLVEALNVKRDPSRNPIFDVMFSFGTKSGFECPKGLKVSSYDTVRESAQFDIVLDANEDEDSIEAALEYSTRLFDRKTIIRMSEHIKTILGEIAANADKKIADINILPEGEKRKILEEFNDTALDVPFGATIQDLFKEAAAAHPQKTALVFRDKKYTYRELDEITNRLAARLRKKGIKPGSVSAILINRSEDIIISMLGIIKAGGAY